MLNNQSRAPLSQGRGGTCCWLAWGHAPKVKGSQRHFTPKDRSHRTRTQPIGCLLILPLIRDCGVSEHAQEVPRFGEGGLVE